MYKKNRLSSAVLAVMTSVVASHQVVAQGPAVSDTNSREERASSSALEEVVVMGIKGSLQRSMDVKRDGAGVVDAISSKDIGKFPDQNLAESLQRITGVSIDRSGGEGQLITVRGFGPQFNTVLVNGRQIASENQGRAFSFDTIASELVSSINVHKTSTAITQSGGIGATVNVTTARPFELGGFKAAGSVKALYDENSEETTPEVSGLISNLFMDDTLGVLVAVSHKESNTRLNQAQTDGWLENVGIPKAQLNGGEGAAGNIFSARNYDNKVTFEERTRTNANLVLQYAASDELEFTVDALYSDFDIETDSTSYGHWFTGPNVENAITDRNGTVIDMYQENGLATDFHAKKFDRLTETQSYGFNAKWDVNESLNLSFDASMSTAEREANNGRGNQLSLIGYANRVRFRVDDAVLPWASDFQSPRDDIVDGDKIVRPVSDYLDPANGRAHVMLRRGWAVEDDIKQFRMDGLWDEGIEQGLVSAKFGTMYSNETKALQRWDNEGGVHCTFCAYPNFPDIPDNFLSVFDAGSGFLSGVSGSGRTPTKWLKHDGEKQFAFLEGISGQSFDAVLKGNSYEVEEETLSVYIEFEFAGQVADMPLSVMTGVRYESTDVTVRGTKAAIESLEIKDETEMVATYGPAVPVSTDNDYSYLLPNLSVKLDISEELIARFAASQTLTRPTLESMASVPDIGTTRPGGDLTATAGEAALKPFLSDNIDISLEWYYDDASYVSLGYFQKNVSNFIVNGTVDQTFVISDGSLLTDPTTGTDPNNPDPQDSVAVFKMTIPNNGDDAQVRGLEFAAQHTFGESGFGVIFNATLVDSDSELDVSDINQKFAVTGLSDSMNWVGFYESDVFQIRLAYNYRDKFLQSLTQTNGDGVTFVDDYQQWDMSGSYQITDNIAAFFEITNLTEEVVTKHGRYDNHFLLAEDAGRRFAVGLSASF